MNVVITGGAGFLGSRLARELLAAGSVESAGGAARPLSRVTLIDRAPVPPDLAADGRVAEIRGELDELLDDGAGLDDAAGLRGGAGLGGGAGVGEAAREALARAEAVFHLAAAVSAECEADFDLGMRANLRATQALLACCRAAGTRPVVVFASSLAVFGTSVEHPLPPVIDDHTLPSQQTSYGIL